MCPNQEQADKLLEEAVYVGRVHLPGNWEGDYISPGAHCFNKDRQEIGVIHWVNDPRLQWVERFERPHVWAPEFLANVHFTKAPRPE